MPLNIPRINNAITKAARANRDRDHPSVFQEAYGAAWLTINESNEIIARLNKSVFILDNEQSEIVFLILFNCLSDIISAVYTMDSGWIRPSVIALRGALENIAIAIVIHHDARKMEKFKQGILKIPRDVIGPANEILPSVKRLYGLVTNQWTHETFDTIA